MDIDYDAIKQMTKAMWSLGDYGPMAKIMEPAARDVIGACGISPGQEVLDVAAGNGNCAVVAARDGARVVASDITPALVEAGRARSAAEGLDIDWVEADVEDLPFEDGRFDVAASVFGAIFAPRPEVAASEMFRVLRPGGILAMANWTPDSFAKHMMDVVARYSPPPPVELPSPFRWGEEETVRSLFRTLAESVRCDRQSLMWEFASFEEMRAVFESHGGAVMAKRMLPPEVYEAQARDLQVLVGDLNQATNGRVTLKNDYLLVLARKAEA